MPEHPKFPDELVTAPIWGRSDYVRILKSFRFVSDKFGPITAEIGFDTDGASIPSVVRPLINPGSQLRFASLPHDVAYWYQAVSCEPGARKLLREEADLIILEAMEACGCSWFLRKTVYSQLRLWGWVAWNANIKKRAKESATGIYEPIQ